MPKLYPESGLAGRGDKETVRPSQFGQETLSADNEVTVWSEEVKQDQALYHGFGVRERSYAEAFVGLDLVATGNGTASGGDPIKGDVVLAVTDSEQRRVLASVTFEGLGELRDSLAEVRSDRIVEPAMAPFAQPGRHLEIRIDADPDSDGAELDPDASDGKLYYGQITG